MRAIARTDARFSGRRVGGLRFGGGRSMAQVCQASSPPSSPSSADGSGARAQNRASAAPAVSDGALTPQLTQLGAGAVAGLVNTLVLSPLDVVKTRLQVQSASGERYRGAVHALRTMLREEGAGAYYRGLSASVWAFVPNWAIYWATYEACKRRYSSVPVPPPVIHIFSALTAGAVTAVTTAPFWTLKSRLQTDLALGAQRRYKSVPHGLAKIAREEGVAGLYRGLTPSLLGLGHVAVQFPLYEYLKSQLSGDSEEMKPRDVLIASSLSKIAASTLFYPHEVLRTRIQVDRTVVLRTREPGRVVNLAKEILMKDGWKGFYRGFGANLLRTVPACMLTFSSYEFAKRFVESRSAAARARAIADAESGNEAESIVRR